MITVSPSYVYGSSTILTASALSYSHASGVAIGNLPTAIKQATILVTTAMLKIRGDSSMTMSITTAPSKNFIGSDRYGSEIALALQMVQLYRRIR
jgi:hypothetical protein